MEDQAGLHSVEKPKGNNEMKGNHKQIWDQELLISRLETVYALIDTSYSVLKHHNVLELDSTQRVLQFTYDEVNGIIDSEKEKLSLIKKAVQS